MPYVPPPILIGGGPLTLEIDPDLLNSAAPPRDPVAPEFGISINECKVPEKEVVPKLPTDQASSVVTILEQLWSRLKGGLDPVWNDPVSQDPEWTPAASASKAKKNRIEADERWARFCTELMFGNSYGSAPLYWDELTDAWFFKAFVNEMIPVAPILMACQQLCTFAILSRGYGIEDVKSKVAPKETPDDRKRTIGVSAGPNGYLNHLFVGGWDTKTKYRNIDASFGRPDGPITPGSIFGFSPPPGGDESLKHAAFVLRVARSTGQAQFFDTGAVHIQGRSRRGNAPKAMEALGGGSGLFDDKLYGGDVDASYVGLGVLKAKTPDEINEGVDKARLARPLGLARLAVFKRSAKGPVSDADILYVSPRLLMHDTASAENFYCSRYFWSLRTTPGYEHIQVLWEIAIPKFKFATEMRVPRTEPLSRVWTKSAAIKGVLWITVESDGSVRCVGRRKSKIVKKLVKDKEGKMVEKGVTDLVDEPAAWNVPFANVVARLDSTPPGERYASPSLQGSLDDAKLPEYFRQWTSTK